MKHPIIRRLLGIIILGTLSIGVAPASFAQEAEDPQDLLEAAARTMLDLKTVHFALSTPVGATMLTDQVELAGIEGDIVRPDRFQAKFTVKLGFLDLELAAIGIGQKLWIDDPLEQGESWVLVAGEGDETLPPMALLNPDQLVLQAVELLENAAIIGREELDGTPATVIEGTFDPNDLSDAATPLPDDFLSSLDPLGVSLWIDDESHIVRAEFAGAILPSEVGAGRVVRRVDFSAFDKPVTIEEPEPKS